MGEDLKWELVASSVLQGGLGILNLGDMNEGLAAKWIYRYANCKDALWRKVIYARSNGDPNSLMHALGNNSNSSILLNFVNLSIGRNGRAKEVINSHFKILIDDCRDTNF